MTNDSKKTDQEKGDEVLRRLLKTPPKPKEGTDRPSSSREGEDQE
tara:strand:- start:3184 stop:3318 length:135 start_codon:yes stop_codon:yes gene_type:complete